MIRKAILVASFGTTYNDTRKLTIDAIEGDIAAAFPQYEIRRAFTSHIVAARLAKRDGIVVDNPAQALERLLSEGFSEVAVQPTTLMDGNEYDKTAKAFNEHASQFDAAVLGRPLLSSDEDFSAVARAVCSIAAPWDALGTAIVFMGHGSEAAANASYAKLQGFVDVALAQDASAQHMTEQLHSPVFIGTVEGTPTLDDMLVRVKECGATRVVLQNLMVVAGDHANNDLAGDGDGSWKSVFEHAGYEVQAVVKGLGEYPEVRALYVDHVQDALLGADMA